MKHPKETEDPDATPATFTVKIAGEDLSVALKEQRTRVQTVSPEDAAQLKYDWQRATPATRWEFDGRLAVTIIGQRSGQGWADRHRWTLESRLPRLVAALEELAEQLGDARTRAAEARQQRRALWEEAVPAARERYVDEINRERLDEQLQGNDRASRLREYAAVQHRAEALETPVREAVLEWSRWIREEADRCDPLHDPDALVSHRPADIKPWDLDRYMPRGFTASRPPD